MNKSAQLTLGVHLRDDATFDNYLFPDSAISLRATLESQQGSEPCVYLYGEQGSGRSHLLQAACHQAEVGETLYLPLEEVVNHCATEVLAGMENLQLLSLDNLDAVVGNPQWEEALFHLINRARESGCHMLLSANVAPRQLNLQLPDLQSRLSWGIVFHLPDYADDDKLRVLQFRSQRRGMDLSDEAAAYILSRAARGMTELMDVLEVLDRESMIAQRQLSIPFIKSTLGW